ncbi:hypothetical protein ES703_105708 [subsurface metagenome]
MDDRMRELLGNSARCFEECYSPFSHSELSKMKVTADECKALSSWISAIIKDFLGADSQ